MFRKFSLKNSIGNTIDLNGDNYFAYSPEGLGVSFSNTYYGANANFIKDSSSLNQQQFKINILFAPNDGKSYKKYYDFIKFLNYQPLVLSYSIDNVGTFERQCQLSELTKAEVNEWDVIDEPIVLDYITPWYQWIEMKSATYEDEDIQGDGKIYKNVNVGLNNGFYVYSYTYEEDRTPKTYFLLNNDSLYFDTSTASPIEITIKAGSESIIYPEWRIIADSAVVQNDRYYITMPPYSKLIISSDPQNQRAELITSDNVITNVYQYQDMTKTNFVTAPLGESALHFETINGLVSCKMRKEWVVV